ncbi:MAG: IclR family transcriptional regulator [Lachnospiraceae bacterium]
MSEDKNPIQSAERIFGILELLAERGEMGLLELSQELNLNKTTVHRMLSSLIFMGYAKQREDTQKYSLSLKVVGIAGKLLEHTDILPIVRPYLEALSAESGETVHLVQRDGNHIIYIDKVESKVGSIRMVSYIGMVHPMYCSGVGKAILAALSDENVRQVFDESKIEKKTIHTITEYPRLKEELAKVQEVGYAIDDEENELGVRCIAVSLRDFTGDAKYALSISGPVSRMTHEKIQELSQRILEVREKLSKDLGYLQ